MASLKHGKNVLPRLLLVSLLMCLLVLAGSQIILAADHAEEPKNCPESLKKPFSSMVFQAAGVANPASFLNFPVTSDGSDGQDMPSIAVDANQNLHVVYADNNSTGVEELYYKMFDRFNNVLIAPTLITSDDGNKADYPFVAVDGNGRVHVVWADRNGSDYDVFYQKLDPSLDNRDGSAANLTTIQTVAPKEVSQAGGNEIGARIAIDSSNNIRLVYFDHNSSTAWYRRLDNSGNALGSWVNLGHNCEHQGPVVDTDSSGNAHIATSCHNSDIYYSMVSPTDSILINQVEVDEDIEANFSLGSHSWSYG